MYKTVETNSFWIYEAKVLLLGGKLLTMTLKLKTKSQIMQFSFFILLFSEGYVDRKGNSWKSLGKQTREPGLIREILRGEMFMLFNVDYSFTDNQQIFIERDNVSIMFHGLLQVVIQIQWQHKTF